MRKTFFLKNRFIFFMAILSLLLIAASEIYLAFLMQMLLDIASSGSFLDLGHLLINGAFFLAILTIALLGKRYYVNKFVMRANIQYKEMLLGAIVKKNISSFLTEPTSDYISLYSNDMVIIENSYLRMMFNIVLQGMLLVGGIVAMGILSWKFMIIVVVASFLPILVTVVFGPRIPKAEVLVSKRNASLISFVKDLLTSFTVIKSFKAEQQMETLFASENAKLEKAKLDRRRVGQLLELLATLASNLVMLIIFGVGAYFSIVGVITAGTVVAFLQLVNHVVGSISQLGPMFAEQKAAEELLHKAEKLVTATAIPAGTLRLPVFSDNITLTDLSFTYDSDKYALKDINIIFSKGKSHAIIGASGSGKSTLLNLLLGYYDQYEGSITFDGKEMIDIVRDDIYENISVVQQNVFIFDRTIKDNITMFQPMDSDTILASTKMAGLDSLVAEKGLEYQCGEGGANLSGGEKQRISIARALVRKTPILIMDEATASLDNTTSLEIEESILRLQESMRIVVTHKLHPKALPLYDKIIVLHEGRVVQSGTYDELLKEGGHFKALHDVV